jgi:hypothetical protein
MADPTAPASDRSDPIVVDPPAPRGLLLPRGVRVVEAVDGREIQGSFRWRGVFAADPSDRDLRARVEAAGADGAMTLAGAALARYHEDVVAAGHGTEGFAFMSGFDFLIRDPREPWQVFVRVPSNNPHGAPVAPDARLADEHGPYFEIVVTPPGG